MSARHIICFGNELHGDDGFGAGVYSRLCGLSWPDDVRLFNAGIAGLDALRFLEGCHQAILVDALANVGKAGEVFLLRPDDLAARPQPLLGHGLGIAYMLEALSVLRAPMPDIVIVGVEVGTIQPFFFGLSPKTEQAIPKTVRLIQELLPA